MTNVQADILRKIEEFDTIIIHRHQNPDPDAIGSQVGLQVLIQTSYPKKKVYAVGEEVEGLKFLARMEEIDDEVYDGALVIVCDTGNEERISDQRYNMGACLIKIDHHPNLEPYGDYVWVDTTYSSTCEMITYLSLTSGGTLGLEEDAAQLLYAGIIGDTGRFLYPSTSSRTLALASDLRTFNFDPHEIFTPLYKNSLETARLQGYILQHFQVSEHGVAYITLPKELLESFKVSPTEAANLVNTLSNIEGNHIWTFIVEYGEGKRVRIRSKEVDISGVAKAFNGGGHPLASGASVKDANDIRNLIKALDQLLVS